jgi:hypothetical protein
MAFKKGYSGNVEGRPPGAANKTTQVQREFIQSIIDKQKDKIETELNKLQGKEFLTAITGLMEFVIPKLQRTELKTDFKNEDRINLIFLPAPGCSPIEDSNK